MATPFSNQNHGIYFLHQKLYQRFSETTNVRFGEIFESLLHSLLWLLSGISSMPIYCFNLFLSIVWICSGKTMESLSSPSKLFTSVCVGNFVFVCILPVIAAIMSVGLCLLPISFEMISACRVPPSLPATDRVPFGL